MSRSTWSLSGPARWRPALLLGALVATLVLALPASALEDHPNRDHGFSAEKAFQIGDVDHVNLFNGNMIVTVPLGQRFQVGPQLSYGFSAVYNANVWEYESTTGVGGVQLDVMEPAEHHNAGFGWEVSLGRLEENIVTTTLSSWTYHSADGSAHFFYPSLHHGEAQVAGVLYTRDGSYLRFKEAGSFREVHFPDGTVHRFRHFPQAKEHLRWLPDRMEDPFGNWVSIGYSWAAGGSNQSPSLWTVTDSIGRTQRVYFKPVAPYYGPYGRVDRIELAAFGSQVATYDFGYASRTIQRGCPHNDPAYGDTVDVPMLTIITQPDGSTWSMQPVALSYDEGNGASECTSGTLNYLTLPTLGRIEWDYTNYHFPLAGAFCQSQPPGMGQGLPVYYSSPIGVSTRRLREANGSLAGTWSYDQQLEWTFVDPCQQPSAHPKQSTTTVVDPLGHKRVHYFSTALETTQGFNTREYGLPLTHRTSAGTNRYLSQQIYDGATLKRSIYTSYDWDQDSAGVNATELKLNQRQASQYTVYHDDGNRWAEVTYSSFDGLGHYRTATTNGSFPAPGGGGNVRVTTTNYLPNQGTYPGSFNQIGTNANWVLNTFDSKQVSEGASTARTEYCFQTTTGFLERVRTLKNGTAQHANDLLADFTRDGSGRLIRERYYGGDVQNLSTGSLCSLSLPGHQLRIDHGYQHGMRANSRYFQANGTPFSFYSLNRTIDKATGLPSRSTDAAGLATDLSYDLMGRLTVVDPAQEGQIRYNYVNATGAGTNGARVTIEQRNAAGTVNLAQQRVRYDSFGRVWREEELMPSGVWESRNTSYDALGQKVSVSQQGNPGKVTQYLDYDPFGRLATIRPPDGSGHDIDFLYAGVRSRTRIATVNTSLGEQAIQTREDYDRQGRLVQVVEDAGAGNQNFETEYYYDVGSRLTRVKMTRDGVTQNRYFNYDKRGFLLTEILPEKGPAGNGSVTYTDYDARGRAGRKIDGPFDYTFEYDRAERLTEVRETGGQVLKSFTYGTSNSPADRSNGKVKTAARHNYVVLVGVPYTLSVTEEYTYGAFEGRVSRKDTDFAIDGWITDRFDQSFSYDDLGNRATIGYPRRTGAGDPPRTVAFGYTNGRLTGVPGYANSISYHDNGTLWQVAHSNGVTDTQGRDPNWMPRPYTLSTSGVLPAGNNWSSGFYAYDGSGNVKAVGNSSFDYDEQGRLVSSTLRLGVGGGGATTTQNLAVDGFGNIQAMATDGVYRGTPTNKATNRFAGTAVYDAAGNLTAWNGHTWEIGPFNLPWHWQVGAQEWIYAYTADDERLFAFQVFGDEINRWTLRDFDGKVLTEYTWHRPSGVWTLEKDYIHRGSQLLAAETTSGTHHFTLDHLGTPRLVTDASRSMVAYHVYYPYGEEATAFNQTDERMKFTGHERDLGSAAGPSDDVDYMHARYYSPVMGRLLSVDPISGDAKQPQSWNRYAYVVNNPLKYIDPTGMAEVCTGADDSRACVLVDGDGDGDTSDDDLAEEQIQLLAGAYGVFIAANDGADLGDKGTKVSGGSEADRSLIRAASQFVGANLENGWQNTEIILTNLGAGEAGRMDFLRNSRYPNGVYLLNIDPGEAGHGGNPSSIARTLTHEFLHRSAMSIRGHTSAHRALDDRAKALIKQWGLARMGCPALGGRTWFGFGPQFYSGC